MNNKVLALLGVLFLVFFLTVSFVAGFALGGTVEINQKIKPPTSAKKTTSKVAPGIIDEILGQVGHSYVDDIDQDKLVNGAIDGILKALDDPYTKHMKKSEYNSFRDHTAGHFGGVGIEITMRKDKLTVTSPIEGTPGAKAGIKTGDIIITIDSTSTKGMTLEKAVSLIRGPEGSDVRLGFDRDGKKIARTITRERIKLPNVSSKVLDKNLGYIKIHAFNQDTASDVRNQLDKVKKKGAEAVIVDLRHNPGGLLDESVQVSGVFIKRGAIVRIKSRSGKTETLSANNDADEDIPLVVLVNNGSASASEIFAGAMQDRGRGIVIGETTFGKGSVQTVVNLSDGSGLILTTAKYLTPNGRSLHKKGIKPDIEIKVKKSEWADMGTDKDRQLNRAKEAALDLLAGESLKEAAN